MMAADLALGNNVCGLGPSIYRDNRLCPWWVFTLDLRDNASRPGRSSNRDSLWRTMFTHHDGNLGLLLFAQHKAASHVDGAAIYEGQAVISEPLLND